MREREQLIAKLQMDDMEISLEIIGEILLDIRDLLQGLPHESVEVNIKNDYS